jgi:hypothetical protein
MKSREERLAEYVRISALLPQATEELMRYPGVREVAVGVKQTDNKVTENVVFRVYVDEKKPLSQLPPGARIPKQLLGVPTDVVVDGLPQLHIDEEKYRPLMGGIQIGNDSSTGHGTMGCLAQLNSDSSIVILSNNHVMMFGIDPAGGFVPGEKIGQPDIACCCCCKCNVVGEVVKALNNDLVDCAIARITPGSGFTNEILDIGFVFGSAPLKGGSTVLPHDRVMKRGRTTGLTRGTVTAPSRNTTANPAAKPPIPARTRQIEITPDPEFPLFSDKGDSGSVIVNESNVVVGLLWGGQDGPNLTFANLITEVISALGITIIDSATAGTIPLGGQPAGMISVAGEQPSAQPDDAALSVMVRGLSESAAGREAIAFFNRHGREINRLLDTNRQVKVSWHRYHGPSFTAHVIQSAKEPEHRIPAEIDGVTPVNLLLRMSVVLQEEGSAALAAAVAAQTVPLLNIIDECDSVQAVLERVSAQDAGVAPAERALHPTAV